MELPCRTRAVRIAVFALSGWFLATGAGAQTVRGRVLNEQTRAALSGAAVTLLGPDSAVIRRVETDRNGFFQIRAGSPGPYRITAEFVGFATQLVPVEVAGDTTIPALLLRSEAIPLDPVEATATAGARTTTSAMGSTRAVLAGARLKLLEQQGASFKTAITELGGRLRVVEGLDRGHYFFCIHAGGGTPGRGGIGPGNCNSPVVVVDGIQLRGTATNDLRGLSLQDYESIEYMRPSEAGHIYGPEGAETGALILWSRGRGPRRDPNRN